MYRGESPPVFTIRMDPYNDSPHSPRLHGHVDGDYSDGLLRWEDPY